jgi:hypothetical protein
MKRLSLFVALLFVICLYSVNLYAQDVLKLGIPLPLAITRVSLVQDKNAEGIKFAKIKAAKVGQISLDEGKVLMQYAQAWRSIFDQVQLDQDANNGHEEGETIEV